MTSFGLVTTMVTVRQSSSTTTVGAGQSAGRVQVNFSSFMPSALTVISPAPAGTVTVSPLPGATVTVLANVPAWTVKSTAYLLTLPSLLRCSTTVPSHWDSD